ncbi:MAG TPA: hypothetical protein VEL28_06465 [Candidatus Binatia bacterium]|nr:hypothetical protein [Candidatus Binatia bacterium]
MTKSTRATGSVIAVFLATAAHAGNGHEYFGPVPYLGLEDSEFSTRIGWCVEDFEDGKFDDAPGVTGNGSVISPGGITDSVDADDGEVDGSGTGGHSYFSGNGAGGIIFTFDPQRVEGLPTAAGIVWTDGGGTISFEAFGPGGQSLGIQGPFSHADQTFAGTTAEDRFYGITNLEGISSIKVTNASGGIEVDHLQVSRCYLCGDGDIDKEVDATDALIALKTAVGTDECLECLCDANGSEDITAVDSLVILKLAVGQTVATDCSACGILM